MKIMFVCLGNICRSPLAEAIFTHEIARQGLSDQFQADSCGTANYHVGDEPDHRTIKVATRHGVPVNHLGRQFNTNDFLKYDWILPMDLSNEAHLKRLAHSASDLQKIRLMRSFAPEEEQTEVPDPYYGGDKDFEEVFQILSRSMQGFIAFLKKNTANP
jgi:protein-tyrosine phosphatase